MVDYKGLITVLLSKEHEYGAFEGCTGLTSITIPNSVRWLGNSAFEGCTGLSSITISNSVTRIYPSTFEGCTELTSITIPNSVNVIGQSTFKGCTGLTSITIPSSVTEIGNQAFSGCSGLYSLTIPSSVTEIGKQAFSGCSGLYSLTINSSAAFSTTNKNIWESAKAHSITFGGTIQKIYQDYDHKVPFPKDGLASVTIGDSVKTIGSNAFYGCSSLMSVTIGDSVKTIGSDAFYGCSSLMSVTIPNSVTSIYSSAFQGCTGLTAITIGDSVESIGEDAFYGCSSLSFIMIPKSVKEIGSDAFGGCGPLRVQLLGETNDIGESSAIENGDVVFEVLTSGPLAALSKAKAKTVILGKEYEETDVTHWSDWTSFEKIYSKETTPPMIGDSFSDFQKKNLRVIVPTEALAAYKNAPVWKDFFFLKGGAETTGVEKVTSNAANEDLPIYRLDGTQVNTTISGHIYIRGGKKFVAK